MGIKISRWLFPVFFLLTRVYQQCPERRTFRTGNALSFVGAGDCSPSSILVVATEFSVRELHRN